MYPQHVDIDPEPSTDEEDLEITMAALRHTPSCQGSERGSEGSPSNVAGPSAIPTGTGGDAMFTISADVVEFLESKWPEWKTNNFPKKQKVWLQMVKTLRKMEEHHDLNDAQWTLKQAVCSDLYI